MSRRVAVLAFVASALVATTSHAGPTAADRETARTLLEQGRALTDKGDMQEALKRFKAADDIMHVPTTGIRVAKAQAALGLLVEARDSVSAIQRTPVAKNESAPFKQARAEAAQLDATLAPRIPSLTITLKGAPAGEEPTLTLDGVDVPATVLGLPRVVDPGHHVIDAKTATSAGTQEIDIAEAERKAVEVALVSTAPPVAEQPTETPDTPPKRSHSPTIVTWVGVGVAGAGVIAGTVTGIMTLGKKSTLKTDCPDGMCGPAGDSALDSANTLATVSTIAFAAAGAGAVAAVVSLAVGHNDSAPAPPAQPAAARLRLVPWLGAGMGGVRGTF
jgi:hypothetical protein